MTRHLFLTVLLLGSCSSAPFAPDTPVPSEARIRKLARIDRAVTTPPRTDLEIQVFPRVILAGSGVWVRCFVPRLAEHRWLAYGIARRRVSWVALDGAEAPSAFELLIEPVACGTHTAFCETQSAGHRSDRRTFTLESLGSCNSGEDWK